MKRKDKREEDAPDKSGKGGKEGEKQENKKRESKLVWKDREYWLTQSNNLINVLPEKKKEKAMQIYMARTPMIESADEAEKLFADIGTLAEEKAGAAADEKDGQDARTAVEYITNAPTFLPDVQPGAILFVAKSKGSEIELRNPYNHIYLHRGNHVYTPITYSEVDLIKAALPVMISSRTVTGRIADRIMDTIPLSLPMEWIMAEEDNNRIYIGGSLYYDPDKGELLTEGELADAQGNFYVFRRLFDNAEPTPTCPKVDTCSDYFDYDKIIKTAYAVLGSKPMLWSTLPELAPLRKAFIGWANGKDSRVGDMLVCLSTILTHRPLFGAVFLIGEGRNGKSAFLHLIETLVGEKNTARTDICDMAEPYSVLTLKRAMVNIRDEIVPVDQLNSEQIKMFKNITGRSSYDAKRYFSQSMYTVSLEIPLFFCTNSTPYWKIDTQACLSRTIPISFTHDFSAQDHGAKEGQSFEQRTFTAEFMATLVGALIGVEWYIRKVKKLPWSEGLLNYRATLREDKMGWEEYVTIFRRHFFAYTSYDDVFKDCCTWIDTHPNENGGVGVDTKYPKRDQLRLRLEKYQQEAGVRTRFRWQGDRYRAWREADLSVPEENDGTQTVYRAGDRRIFAPAVEVPGTGYTIEQILSAGNESIVDIMERNDPKIVTSTVEEHGDELAG